MPATWKSRLLLISLLVLGAAVFCTGIRWGLPSRAVDRYLFGERRPWTGKELLNLTGGARGDERRGADVDINPLAKSGQPLPLNESDAQRAAIAIRYRLYTYQPDEMITMMSLASMRPGRGDLDPKLYQYGGLWIYPVGVLLKLTSLTGAVHLTTDQAWYLDRPEMFGRFYVVARLYVVAWALVGIWTVFWIVRRLTGGSLPAAGVATACYIFMPVVMNMVHEAKPHLPAAVLMLLAVIAATRYADTGRPRWWLAASALCGAAFGMVLSAWPVFIVLPIMVLLRPQPWAARVARAVGGGLLGAAAYLLTNPYIAINWFTNREVLRSNFGNSLAMYEVGRWREGLANAAVLVGEGTSVVLAVFGFLAVVVSVVRAIRDSRQVVTACAPPVREQSIADNRPIWWHAGVLLAGPAVLILLQFVALAAGKPGEYGRFAVLPDIALGIAAVTLVWRAGTGMSVRALAATLFVLMTAMAGGLYWYGFLADSRPMTSRVFAAERLSAMQARGLRTVGLFAESAPYGCPPLDLFKSRLVLLPNHDTASWSERPDVIVRPLGLLADRDERPLVGYQAATPVGPAADPTPLSWANKRFEFYVAEKVLPAATQGER